MSETQPANPSRSKGSWSRLPIAFFFLIFACLVVALLVWYFLPASPDTTTAMTFEGSDQLARTVIVPTLDTPVPPGKNVIWCSSFQLAWNKLKSEIVRGPVVLDEGQDVADRLNTAVQAEADLSEELYYATAGWDTNGIHDEIRREMAWRFPGTPVHLPPQDALGATAYGYLRAQVKFTQPYFDYPKGFRFAQGKVVRGFGLGQEHRGACRELRDQIDVLYALFDGRGEMVAYAVDLCRHSSPNQIVAAVTPSGATVADCLTAHRQCIAARERGPWQKRLSSEDELRVPNMGWRIEHHFTELENRCIRVEGGPPLIIKSAIQAIDFSLDKSGAAISSEASIGVTKKAEDFRPRKFSFDRPFFVIMKKRDAEHPFFVMWVENDELLQKR